MVFVYQMCVCVCVYMYNMWAARDGVAISSRCMERWQHEGKGLTDGLFNLLNRFYELIKYENVTREGLSFSASEPSHGSKQVPV